MVEVVLKSKNIVIAPTYNIFIYCSSKDLYKSIIIDFELMPFIYAALRSPIVLMDPLPKMKQSNYILFYSKERDYETLMKEKINAIHN